MSGLNDLNENQPSGLNTPTQADNELRALKAKIKEYAAVEHAYDGKHKFLVTAVLPANDFGSNRLVIKTTVGMPDEIWYDNGITWKKITSNSEIVAIIADLLAHKTAIVLDHPNYSVTTDKLKDDSVVSSKIGDGSIMRHHMDAAQSGDPEFPTASLVNGSEVDATWHTHPTGSISFGMNFLAAEILVGSGSAAQDWTFCDATTLSSGVIPVTAKGVMLRVLFNIEDYNAAISSFWGRASVSSGIFLLHRSNVVPVSAASFGQVLCPLNGTDGSFQYKVDFVATGTWDAYVQGYFT